MNFPRFWARGTHEGFVCWRWSEVSLKEAAAEAAEAARQLAERFGRGDRLQRRYAYGDRPLREQILREVKNDAGQVAALITRNSYGCLVLNTARVMFVDVDIPQLEEGSGFAFFRRLFGKPSAEQLLADALAKAESWAFHHAGWGWRIYRTRAGLRLLATHDVFDPEAALVDALFDTLGADPLYRRLCKNQKCFRARLTPKPWRCDAGKPPCRWPWSDAATENRFKEWETAYTAKCATLATCELVRTAGNQAVHPEVRPIVNLHDETARAQSRLALA